MEAVGIRPMASRYVKVVQQDEESSNMTPLSSTLIFRATLRNGQMFAIDPRSSVYNFTTTAEHEHGVFEWELYMEHLQIADRTTIEVLPLRRVPLLPVPSGNLADGQAGNFLNADIRSTAEMKAVTVFIMLGEGLREQLPAFLPLENYQTTFAKLMRRSSNHREHASEVYAFKQQLQEAIRLSRSLGTKEALLDRLRINEAV
jgi:hypothetical protein